MPHLQPKRILVAPLDWGLGHATRCIPLIRELLHLGCDVLIGAEGIQADLLHEEFPGLPLLPLPGYRIRYSSDASGFGIKMVQQLPQIRRAVLSEHRQLERIRTPLGIDAVISDNRFGLHLPEIPCVIMTHQLHIKSPFRGSTETWLQKYNYRLIQKFDSCWVVDFEGPDNLAGDLSHPVKMPRSPTRFLGAISRFEYENVPSDPSSLLVLISGPEPQRSLFETMMMAQVLASGRHALIVQGRPGHPMDRMVSQNVRVVNHLNGHALNEAILQSGLVLCRSGYTSVMDLIKLRKKAILVPTPGQTEQEYLGAYLMKKNYFMSAYHENFDLDTVLKAAASFPFRLPDYFPTDHFKTVLAEFVASL